MSDELPPLGSELEAMFDAAKAELPSAAAKAKARAALGLPSAVVTPPAPAPAAPATGATTSAAGSLTVVKGLLVLGLVGGAYALGVRTGDTRAREAFAALPPKTVIVEVPVPAKPEPIVEVPVVAVAVDVPDAGVVKAPPVKRPVVEDADDLTAELALLDAARTTLAANDTAKALATLSKYDATFPRGTMRTDAQLLRLETLLKAGRRAEAETLGKKLSSATDSELVRERVRRLLDAK